MAQAYVYKIRRKDGLEYIGITTDVERRIKQHSRSKRFSIGISSWEILEECSSYGHAEEMEEHYIDYYDTFENGLNVTKDGKGKNGSCVFNTCGFRFSEESRKKMSESAKNRMKRGDNKAILEPMTEETKRKLSEKRKGKFWSANRVISTNDCAAIYEAFSNDTVQFSDDFISKYVKQSQKDIISTLLFSELKSKNGKCLTKETLYAYYFSEKFNVTPQAIKAIIKKKGEVCPNYDEI